MVSNWDLYTRVYMFITLGYLWYRFILLFLAELREKKRLADSYNNELISVVVPFYNEDPEILEKTVNTLLAAHGNKEIVLVDDGSPDLTCYNMINEKYTGNVKLVRYEKNEGKRNAQKVGFENSKGVYTVFIDSDTIIMLDTLINLVKPFSDESVGATTGNVKVLNQEENMLTKMVAARYWNAFNVERKSLSSFGVVTCCSGALSAYRSRVLKDLMPYYMNQRFLGEICTYGDDRHLTNLVLMKNLKIIYVAEAVCYTVVPTTYRKFFKQQLRWKKSFLRESYVSLQFAFRHSFLLPLEVLFNAIIPFLSIGIRISLILSLVFEPALIPMFIISVVTLAVIRNFFLFFEDRKMAFYSIPYAFVHEIGLFWLYFVALLSLKENSWGTR